MVVLDMMLVADEVQATRVVVENKSVTECFWSN